MSSYCGGKSRIGLKIAKEIYSMCKEIEIKSYCEPFCGMLGVYQHIPELFRDHIPELKYKAGDINKSVIMMWKAAQKGWKPPTEPCTRENFEFLRSQISSSVEKGFYGHQCSFGGKYFQ